MMTVTNPKLRAKLDRMYRENPRWREFFLQGYETVAMRSSGQGMACLIASNAKWPKLDPGARDFLEIRMRRAQEERNSR